MCGIIGIYCKPRCNEGSCVKVLHNGLKYMQNRGYDSAGIVTIQEKSPVIHKYASTDSEDSLMKLNNVLSQHKDSNIGFGHTRWATHGSKTDNNSHPHKSNQGIFTLVHNGIIDNYAFIKIELLNNGYTFYSETDTEIICNYLEYIFLKKCDSVMENTDKLSDGEYEKLIIETIEEVQTKMSGSWGLVIFSCYAPDTLFCVRHGSPILIGKNDNEVLIASEQAGFGNRVNTYFILNTNDVCVIRYCDSSKEIKINTSFTYSYKKTNTQVIRDSPAPYPHWTIREIYEQENSARNAISMGGRVLSKQEVRLGGLHDHKDIITSATNIILLGCGTSYHSGFIAREYFKRLCNVNCVLLFDGAEFTEQDIPKNGDSIAIFISQSGETKDLHRCISIAKSNNVFTVGVVNVVDSLIAREVNCGVYLNAGTEVAVASTKSFTSQSIVLTMIAIWIGQQKKINAYKRTECITDIQNLSQHISQTLRISNERITDGILSIFDGRPSCFLLGKGMGEGTAREGALKIKEITYVHAEGYSSSALKHGPFALLDKGFPVILFSPSDEHFAKNQNAFQEVYSRGASIIVIHDDLISNDDNENEKQEAENKNVFESAVLQIRVPKNSTFQSILNMIPIQMLAYKLAVRKGINPDKPKNLAKVVTVE